MDSTGMQLLAIDPGTHSLGWALWEVGELLRVPSLVRFGLVDGLHGVGHRQRLRSPVHRLVEVVDSLEEYFRSSSFPYVAIEKPPYIQGRPNGSLLVLGQTLNWWAKKRMQAEVIDVYPASVKAYVRHALAEKGIALKSPSKQQVSDWVRKTWLKGQRTVQEDEADAIVIGLVAIAKLKKISLEAEPISKVAYEEDTDANTYSD